MPIDTTVLAADQPAAEYLTAEVVGAAAGYWYFVEDTEIVLATPAEGLELMVQPDQQGYAVTAAASSLVKDLTLFPDRLDPSATVDSGLVTLQSGQSHTFHVISAARDLDAAAWFRKPVLRCVNDLVGRSAS